MDIVGARTADGRWFRTLTVVDAYARESLALVADRTLIGITAAVGPLRPDIRTGLFVTVQLLTLASPRG